MVLPNCRHDNIISAGQLCMLVVVFICVCIVLEIMVFFVWEDVSGRGAPNVVS